MEYILFIYLFDFYPAPLDHVYSLIVIGKTEIR